MNHIIQLLILPIAILTASINNCYSSDNKNIDKRFVGNVTDPVAWFGMDSYLSNPHNIGYISDYCDNNNLEKLKSATLDCFTLCNRISHALFGTQINYEKGMYNEISNWQTLVKSYNDISYLYNAFELSGLEETEDLKSFYEFKNLSNYNIIVPSNSLNKLDSSTDIKLFDKQALFSTDINIVPLSFYIGNRILALSHNIFDKICTSIEQSDKSSADFVERNIILNTIKPCYNKLSIISNNLNAVNQKIHFNITDTNTRNNAVKYLNATFNYISDVLNNSCIPQMYNQVNGSKN